MGALSVAIIIIWDFLILLFNCLLEYVTKCLIMALYYLQVREFGRVRIVVRTGCLFAIGEASEVQGRILVGTKK